MRFGVAILVFVGLVTAVFHYAVRLVGDDRSDTWRWFWTWLCKGLALPVLVWVLWNSGILPGLPAIMPQIPRAQAGGGNWGWALFEVTASALFVIGSYWAAVTLAWFLSFVARREEIRNDFVGSVVVWSILMIPLGLFIIYATGWAGAGLSVVLWLLPIAHSSMPLLSRKKVGPLYSRAIAKMKFGKYEDAEWDILHELEKGEDDVEGWLMLAELYATHFHDLAEAQRTIHDICSQPNVTPSQIAIALNRLADWHLKMGEDPVAARRALHEICQKLPGTHLATMARHRINQLPANRGELREQQKGRTIHLPALTDQLQELRPAAESEAGRAQALTQADQYVGKLKQDPDNVPVREELARLFADRLERPELAIEQLELLLGMPGQPAPKAAEWLSLMAAWQLKHRRDHEAARLILERLVREYPQSVQAFAAQRHLKLMEMELKIRTRAENAVGSPSPRAGELG